MAGLSQFITGNGDNPCALVVVFLRGGADGLNMVAPFEDDGYFRARPRIAIRKENSVRLDDYFGLNPLLRELEPAYRDGALAVVHACGSEDDTRSHFEAQDLMEHGGLMASGGWLGRFLRALPQEGVGPLSAVAIGTSVPESLRGAPAATVMESFETFSLGKNAARFTAALGRLYALENSPVGHAGRDTLDAVERIERLAREPYRPAAGVSYAPNDHLARGLQEVARLIKARVGLVAACLDLEGWDSHLTQGVIMDPLMTRLGRGLSDFYRDLGKAMETTTVVVMTEFGRRVFENASFGTDHGRGSVMFVLGGGIKGGRVLARWPTLDDAVLEGPGDLPVTTNYRDVLAPVLIRQGVPTGRLQEVFPHYDLSPLQLFG